MLSNQYRIGIIGGGASGVFTLCNIVDQKIDADNLSPLDITLIEKNNTVGEGMAYRADYTSNLLNTAAGLFSGMDDDRDFYLKNQPTFLKWVRENFDQCAEYCPQLKASDITKNSYLPRCLVGIYLRDIMNFYIKIAPNYNITVHFICAEAVDLYCDAQNTWKIILSDKKTHTFSHVVLALGGFLKRNFDEFKSHDYYFDNPWPKKEDLRKILSVEKIGIIGTKLSALDTVAILKSHDYQGKIMMASHSGFLPSVKNVHHYYTPLFLTMNTLEKLAQKSSGKIKLNDLVNLLKAEIDFASKKNISWTKLFLKKKFSMEWLNWQIKMAKDSSILWQSVLAATSDFFVAAWQYLNIADKIIFKKDFSVFWETYRFSMPLGTANEISSLIHKEKLILISDVTPPKLHRDKFIFSGFDCYSKKLILAEVDVLINATGINYDVNTMESTLLRNMLDFKTVKPDSLGGIIVNFDDLTVPNQKNLYVIGDLTKGVFFFTNSYLVCSNQASLIAKSILKDCDAIQSFSVLKIQNQRVYA